mmetsp:Transcript_60250/g.123772  ORF Transcript_60250/g.123772 Transcript_60250/m.123772 type:complete len:229 (+) Transcript_60250:185-871(+)
MNFGCRTSLPGARGPTGTAFRLIVSSSTGRFTHTRTDSVPCQSRESQNLLLHLPLHLTPLHRIGVLLRPPRGLLRHQLHFLLRTIGPVHYHAVSLGARFDIGVAERPHVLLVVLEKLLLRTEDATGSHHADVTNRLAARELVLAHQPAADERASPPQPRLAVHRDGPLLLAADVEPLVEHGLVRRRAVIKVNVIVVEASVDEILGVVMVVVEAHNRRHSHALEDLEVG